MFKVGSGDLSSDWDISSDGLVVDSGRVVVSKGHVVVAIFSVVEVGLVEGSSMEGLIVL